MDSTCLLMKASGPANRMNADESVGIKAHQPGKWLFSLTNQTTTRMAVVPATEIVSLRVLL